jgi:hypothetical protein
MQSNRESLRAIDNTAIVIDANTSTQQFKSHVCLSKIRP